jgi:microcystin-dependent protein
MSDPYVGEIRMFGGNFAPAGWALCKGDLLAISENETLFQLIGTTYGGDGQETFGLPDLRGRFPVHQASGFVMGEMAGTEEETLSAQQIPVHSHSFLASQALASQPTPGGNLPAQSGTIQLFVQDTPAVPLDTTLMTPAGGSQPHENMHPYLVINFIISLFGEFPIQ